MSAIKKENKDLKAQIKDVEAKGRGYDELVKALDFSKQENERISVCCLIHSALCLFFFVLMGLFLSG